MCLPPDTPNHINDDSIPEDVENAYNNMINTLFSWRKKARATPTTPCRLTLTPKAKVLFGEYHNELANERVSLPSGAMKANLSKLSGYVMRIALTLHVARVASLCQDGKVPEGIPPIGEEAMKAAITLTRWYKRENQRILLMLRPSEIVTGDKEVAAILGHIQRRGGRTTARIVRQNVGAFDCVGGMELATKKLEEMVASGLLITDDQNSKKREYALPSVANANGAPAVDDETDDSVGGCRQVVGRFVGDENDAKPYENKGLEEVVGFVGGFGGIGGGEADEEVVGDLGECETEEDTAECHEAFTAWQDLEYSEEDVLMEGHWWADLNDQEVPW